MDLDDLIVVTYCLIDEWVRALTERCRLRRRAAAPVLADAEVLTMEVVGELLGLHKASQDPTPQRSRYLSRICYRIETVFGQLVERYQIKHVRARDLWHLGSRLMRKVLSHTLARLLT